MIQSTAWNDTTTHLPCTSCHYYAIGTTATLAGNSTNASLALSSDHGKHFGSGGSFACADCHGTDPVAGDTSHINGVTSITDKAVAAQDEANVTVTTWVDGTDTCSNTACHNPSGTTYSAVWESGTSNSSCTLCHSATDPGTGSHNKHVNTFTNGFGLANIACTGCHVNNGINNAHRNGTVTFAAGMGYTAGAEDVLGTVGTCTTTTCHNDGKATPTAVPTTNWGTPSADCTICHGNAPATGKHAKHANATYVVGSCGDCHTAANVATHINGSRNMSSKVTDMDLGTGGNQLTAPGGWNGTCTNNCHIANTATDWTAGTLACTDCHGSGKVTTPLMDRGWPPTSGAHGNHVGNFYVAANCVDCHNNNTVTHSTLNNVVTVATGVKLTANPGNGSCTNTCHLAAQVSDWTGGSAAVTCVDCHTSGKIGGGANDKTSGLHIGPLTVSNTTHDQTLHASGCAICHVSVLAQGTHINGNFTGGNTQTTQMGLTSGIYAQTADNTGTCSNACHSDGGAWARKWSTTAQLSDGSSECANCHGDFDSGFVAGMAARHQTAVGDPNGKIASSHDGSANGKCSLCHNYIKGDNTYYNIAPGNQHRDGKIQINSNVGFVDNVATVGCSKCHSSNDGLLDGQHEFSDTTARWTRLSVAGPPVSCGSCHGYPPSPLDGKPIISVEGKGAHVKHVNNIAARAAVTLNATSDSFIGNPVCGACHDVTSGTNHSTGGGPRNLLTPATSYQFGPARTYNGTVGLDSVADPKTCSNVSCHFKTTPVWE